MLILLLLLWAVIGAYAYLTNGERVRKMAGDYLTGLVGAKVNIGSADLSIFEGLRLDNVRIDVPDGTGPESSIFDAATVFIQYNFADLIRGRLNATQIIASDTHVRLAHDLNLGRWNYELLGSGNWMSHARVQNGLQTLPEVLLRNAEVDYLEVSRGRAVRTGWIAAELRFGPGRGEPNLYEFNFNTRGSQTLGPAVSGTVDLHTGHITAKLNNFIVGPDILAMLPAEVRQWCQVHELAGRLSLTLDERPDVLSGKPDFAITALLDGGQFKISSDSAIESLKLTDTAGSLTFTNDGIKVTEMSGWIGKNGLVVDGFVGGYTADAPFNLSFGSIGVLNVPRPVPYVDMLPHDVKEVFYRVDPSGKATLELRLSRAAAGGNIECEAKMNVLDGQFTWRDVPYTVNHATGVFTYGRDPTLGFDVVRMIGIRGFGSPGTPNENAVLTVDGWVGPFDDRIVGGYVVVGGLNIHAEEKLKQALPRPAQLAWNLLDANPDGSHSTFTATFRAVNQRQEGPGADKREWVLKTDVDLKDGHASYVEFPYTLRDLSGKLEVSDGYVNVAGLQCRHGATKLRIDGRVGWDETKQLFLPDLRLAMTDMPIDGDFLAALPKPAREPFKKLNIGGVLDAVGHVAGGAGSSDSTQQFDLHVALRDGSAAPAWLGEAVTGLAGHFDLTPQRLTVADIAGHRGAAALRAHGWVDWAAEPRVASFVGEADDLGLDENLFKLVPADTRAIVDQLKPFGSVDAVVVYDNETQPASPMQLTIHPRHLSAQPRFSAGADPLDLQEVGGWLSIRPNVSAECNLTAALGKGHVGLAGTWDLANPRIPWNLRFSATDLKVDSHLAASLPRGVASVISGLQLNGTIGLNVDKFLYLPEVEAADFDARVDCKKTTMNVGVEMGDIDGRGTIAGQVRNGKLGALAAEFSAQSLTLAGRPAGDLHVSLEKPPLQDQVQVKDFQATVAGGQMTADATMYIPDSGPGDYTLDLILRDADVTELTALKEGTLDGTVSVSLNMGGRFGDDSSRRGRGDVRVTGKSLYRIPLLLGLMQVTNLSLPATSPFDNAFARYSLDGDLVSLDRIDLNSKSLSMQGHGHIDFASKQVELSFVTNHPDWMSLPLIGPIWSRAQSELLRIHIKGSLQSPTVSASSLDTVTTTVDQVIRGEEGK
jgi:hypothetical protein